MEFKFLFNKQEKDSINNLKKIGAIRDCFFKDELTLKYENITSEHLPILMILESMVTVKENNNLVKIHVEEYLREYKNNTINEVITRERKGKSAYNHMCIEEGKSLISSAIYLEIEENRIKEYKAAIGGTNIGPFRLYEIENLVIGKNVEYLSREKTVDILTDSIVKKIQHKYNMTIERREISNLYRETLKNVMKRVVEEIV